MSEKNSYKIVWLTMNGDYRTDYFCTQALATNVFGKVWNELTYVQVWDNPRLGLEIFLKNLPFLDVTIKVI